MAAKFGVQNVFDMLDAPSPSTLPHVVAVVGNERFLKRLALDHLLGDNHESDLVRYTADEHPWADIEGDLSTGTLFGSGPKRVLLHDADDLITHAGVQAYAARAAARGSLILDLETLPSNTKLYKSIAQHGWLLQCRPPEKDGRSKAPDVPRMTRWLSDRAQQRHQIKLSREALQTLIDLIGWEYGLLDQELAKLALFVDRGATVSPELVRRVVGGWRTETTWEMLEAAADGDAATALRQLDQLLQAGESPQSLFGSIAWFLRRFNAATRTVERLERQAQRVDLGSVLLQAGFRQFPPDALARAGRQIKQLTRHRAGELFARLLDVDLALKGSHSSPERSRWKLESLLLFLAKRPV
jgi:DNA polymerase-3 subunit delta